MFHEDGTMSKSCKLNVEKQFEKPLYQRGQSWFRSNGLLLLGLVPHLASKLFASFLHVRYCCEFSIRQTCGSFNGIWSDMGTGKTIIKDSKSSGGIVGITNQKSALVR
jgi:hypothetical protein